MENNLSPDRAGERPKKRRGRPPGSRKISADPVNGHIESRKNSGASYSAIEKPAMLSDANGIQDHIYEEYVQELTDCPPDEEEKVVSSFNSLLREILRRDRSEITRVARELEVAENTVYRWINGSSEPRIVHLRRLPDVLPEHRSKLIFAINQTFEGVLDIPTPGLREVRKEVYHRVIEIVAACDDPDMRFWQVSQAIFDYALLHLDLDHHGLALTFAKLLPPRADEIHVMREMAMRGTPPWPYAIESRAYLGSTSLAGTAAALQRPQLWNIMDGNNRALVEIDQFEQSACAIPVMRGNLMAGVFIVSSTQPNFFLDPMACQAVADYALMMGVALSDTDFYQFSQIHLRPMPPLAWQREYMIQAYIGRVLDYARAEKTSRYIAEQQVQLQLEQEFEKMGGRKEQITEQRADVLEHLSNSAESSTMLPG